MNSKKTVLIADDEEHICSDLRYIISQDPRVEIIQVCTAGDQALECICTLKPDIIFLDINMPKLNGIQLGRYLKAIRYPFYLAYITAYSEYAIEAFKVGAKGYVMKPFSADEVIEQIDLALESLKGHPAQGGRLQQSPPGKTRERISKIAVEWEGSFHLLEQQNVLMAYAQNRLVYLQAGEKTYISRFSLSELEERLQPELFFRCHRNYIVNLSHVKAVQPWFHGTYMLCMDDGKTNIPVSRAHVAQIRELFYL